MSNRFDLVDWELRAGHSMSTTRRRVVAQLAEEASWTVLRGMEDIGSAWFVRVVRSAFSARAGVSVSTWDSAKAELLGGSFMELERPSEPGETTGNLFRLTLPQVDAESSPSTPEVVAAPAENPLRYSDTVFFKGREVKAGDEVRVRQGGIFETPDFVKVVMIPAAIPYLALSSTVDDSHMALVGCEVIDHRSSTIEVVLPTRRELREMETKAPYAARRLSRDGDVLFKARPGVIPAMRPGEAEYLARSILAVLHFEVTG